MFNFKATGIIDAAFTEDDIKHFVVMHGKSESVHAPFPVLKGPMVDLLFISRDNDNDVSVRVLNLFNDIPENDWPRVLRTLNKLNSDMRFVKFCLDDAGDISIEYDFPVKIDDDSIGPVACEMFYRIANIVNKKYKVLVDAVYFTPDRGEGQSFEDLVKGLMEDEDGDWLAPDADADEDGSAEADAADASDAVEDDDTLEG